MARLSYPFVCGLDWLQLFVHLHKTPTNYESKEIKVEVTDFPTKQFLSRARIFLRVQGAMVHFCELLFTPRTSVLPRVAGMLKVENARLYESDLMPRLSFVMSNLDIEYRSLSRVDVFYDCNKFYGGKSPRQFVQDYVGRKVLKIGINKGFINFANLGYTVANGTRKMPAGFKIGTPVWTGVTWGSRDYVQTQIYDKSRELREVKYKPHIVDAWQAAGLDPSCVWRCEMRIAGKGQSITLVESGDLFSLGAYEVANSARVRELFQTYADRHLRFVYKDYHAKRQQMRRVVLFGKLSENEVTIKPKIRQTQTHSLRTVNLVKKFLCRLEEYAEAKTIEKVTPRFTDLVSTMVHQIDVTFPSYLFQEKKQGDIDIFRRLNDALLRNVHWVGRGLDVFTSAWLHNYTPSSDIPNKLISRAKRDEEQ